MATQSGDHRLAVDAASGRVVKREPNSISAQTDKVGVLIKRQPMIQRREI